MLIEAEHPELHRALRSHADEVHFTGPTINPGQRRRVYDALRHKTPIELDRMRAALADLPASRERERATTSEQSTQRGRTPLSRPGGDATDHHPAIRSASTIVTVSPVTATPPRKPRDVSGDGPASMWRPSAEGDERHRLLVEQFAFGYTGPAASQQRGAMHLEPGIGGIDIAGVDTIGQHAHGERLGRAPPGLVGGGAPEFGLDVVDHLEGLLRDRRWQPGALGSPRNPGP